MSVVVREVTDPSDRAIEGFGRMQTAAYFAPETLIPARYVPTLLAETGGARHNFLVVAESDGQVVAGTLFHWLPSAGSGFSSFLGVDRAWRRQGIARRLNVERWRLLEQAAGGPIPGIFIDVVNPTRLSPEELARERVAGTDPWARRRALEHLGFRQVDVRYEQPVGGPDGGPVTNLDLLFCPRMPANRVATSLVVATMRAYWSDWLKSADHHAHELERRAQGAAWLPLLSPVPGG